MLAHQIAAAHGLAMKFAAKSEQMLGFVTSWDTTARQQVSSIEASRLANSAARMMESFNQGLLTLDRLRVANCTNPHRQCSVHAPEVSAIRPTITVIIEPS